MVAVHAVAIAGKARFFRSSLFSSTSLPLAPQLASPEWPPHPAMWAAAESRTVSIPLLQSQPDDGDEADDDALLDQAELGRAPAGLEHQRAWFKDSYERAAGIVSPAAVVLALSGIVLVALSVAFLPVRPRPSRSLRSTATRCTRTGS